MTDHGQNVHLASKNCMIVLAAVSVLALGLRGYGVARQPPLRDETLSAFSAENYAENGQLGPTMPFHPNLRNLVLYGSTRIFGTGNSGLRGPSLWMGTLSIPLLGLLVLRLTRDRLAALLAAFFLAVDPVHITFSRQSIQEVHTAFLFLLATWLFLLAWDDGWVLCRPGWLPVAGIVFGLSAASKAHGWFPLIVCLGVAAARVLKPGREAQTALVGASLVLVPGAVYLLTYLPWLGRGYGLGEWFFMQRALLGEMVGHAGYVTSATLDSSPWQWFLKPLMGYANFTRIGARPHVTIAMGNPLVWLLVLPSSIYLLRKETIGGMTVLQLLFWVSYLPLALSSRPIWLLSSIAVTPFAFGLVGRFLSRVSRTRRKVLAVFLVAVLAASLWLYPMAVGKAWEAGYLRPLVERFNPHG